MKTAFRVSRDYSKILRNRERRIERRLAPRQWENQPQPMMRGYRFIVVDDNENDRLLIRLALLTAYPQASVSMCSDGDEGFGCYQNIGADAVITDYWMPHMNGAELARVLRKESLELVIVVVSGNPDPRQKSLAAGANGFPDKNELKHLPENLQTLLAKS